MPASTGRIASLLLLLIGGAVGTAGLADDSAEGGGGEWSLDGDEQGWWLRTPGGKRLPLAADWLVPESERAAELDGYVWSGDFDREVQVFPIGDGRLGVHASSYAIAGEGSADAAAGRDAFFVVSGESVTSGGIQLGITKARQRSDGIAEAIAHRWFLEDVDGDGLIDIGVLRESGVCHDGRWTNRSDSKPIWFLFQDEGWVPEPEPSGVLFASNASELPPIGLVVSPVEYLRERCR